MGTTTAVLFVDEHFDGRQPKHQSQRLASGFGVEDVAFLAVFGEVEALGFDFRGGEQAEDKAHEEGDERDAGDS